MTQRFHAKCGCCGTTWRLAEPDGVPMPVESAIAAMSAGICPHCFNDGSSAPIRWRVEFKAHAPELEAAE